MRKIVSVFLLLTLVLCSGYRKPYKYTINAEKAAFLHNNLGINYLKERVYYAAIEEFKIAIKLSPNTQATAIFKNNLGETYDYIGYPEQAKICFEDALKLYGLNFKYYLNLAENYKKLKIIDTKIEELKESKNIYDRILIGLLYIQKEDYRRGIIILDEFCMEEPDLLITPTVLQYIKEQNQILNTIPEISIPEQIEDIDINNQELINPDTTKDSIQEPKEEQKLNTESETEFIKNLPDLH